MEQVLNVASASIMAVDKDLQDESRLSKISSSLLSHTPLSLSPPPTLTHTPSLSPSLIVTIMS